MAGKVIIFGKDTCPYTTQAREDYAKKQYEVEYVNVKADAKRLTEMMRHSGGKREVPVIVDAGKVTIGYGGS